MSRPTSADQSTSSRGDSERSRRDEEPEGKRVVVVGSGPGGYTAAFRAADLGLEVTLVERHEVIGGVCLNVGCIPSKALLHAAKVLAEAEDAAEFGISFSDPEIDVDKLRSWKEDVVGKLTGGLDGLAKRRKVNVVHGEAQVPLAEIDSTSAARSRRVRPRDHRGRLARGDAARPARGRADRRLDRRARAAGDPRDPARDRRRDHRARDGVGLRGARARR